MDKLFPWLVWLVSLINAIWLILIPGEKSGAFLNISYQRTILIFLILFPGIALLILRTAWGKALMTRHATLITKITSTLALWILIACVFFLLMPFARYRVKLDYDVWLRLLPVVLTYAI
ncbi:MAG: hypothetical protein IH585_17645, partial [Anaerolineaceae bacterium]|nr:hypothetical protein [Anaerolineaceae bacterium]